LVPRQQGRRRVQRLAHRHQSAEVLQGEAAPHYVLDSTARLDRVRKQDIIALHFILFSSFAILSLDVFLSFFCFDNCGAYSSLRKIDCLISLNFFFVCRSLFVCLHLLTSSETGGQLWYYNGPHQINLIETIRHAGKQNMLMQYCVLQNYDAHLEVGGTQLWLHYVYFKVMLCLFIFLFYNYYYYYYFVSVFAITLLLILTF
jgi:hypothetical protein